MYEKLNRYDCTLETYNSIQKKINFKFQKILSSKKVFLALDGYIDTLYSVIKTHKDQKNFIRFNTIKDLADHLYKIQGSSGNIEIKLKKQTSGGFVANNGKALSALNINVFLFGALGFPKINDIFKPLKIKNNIDIFTYKNPAHTIGLEFDDGKIMLSDYQNFSQLNWKYITKRIDSEIIINRIEQSDAIGFGYWGLNPELNNIWRELLDSIFPSITNLNKKIFFLDLGDIKKRIKSDILKMLQTLRDIEKKIPVLLSLNDQEAIDLFHIFDSTNSMKLNKIKSSLFIEVSKRLIKELKISYLIIHSPYFAIVSIKNNENLFWITEGFTSKPSFTVSAGDHFLSGVIAGFLGKLTPPEAILLGNALTAIFVRTGESANFNQLKSYIANYMKYVEEDFPHFPYDSPNT
ncbi:MAG: hypothetical protein JXA99_07215 [Candidatus Lokiarchaeota archaeon]|nr:hypothetical protein [Candidatus Lokiarchaeota archaeon]